MSVTENPNQIRCRRADGYYQKKYRVAHQVAAHYKIGIIRIEGRFLEGEDIIVTSHEITIFLVFGIISK